MPLKRDQTSGKLVLKRIPKDLCWGKPVEFIKSLVEILGVELPSSSNNRFVVVGHEVPESEDKGKLWVRTSRGGVFLGYYFFQDGEWQRIHNFRPDQVVWLFGDSRVIPEGFQLIDTGVGVPSDIIDFLKKKYLVDTANSTPTQTVYRYFAVRYVGP